jgi:hypothetical protein
MAVPAEKSLIEISAFFGGNSNHISYRSKTAEADFCIVKNGIL